jgi:hypothetical protein
MMHRPDAVPHFQRIGLLQGFLQVILGGSHRTGRKAANAADSVQPVPCVWRVATRGAVKRCSSPALNSQSGLSLSLRWPPFIKTVWQPIANSARPCSRIWRSFSAGAHSSRAAASGRFGVIIDTSGNSSRRIDSTASGASRGSPLFASITVSSTTNDG